MTLDELKEKATEKKNELERKVRESKPYKFCEEHEGMIKGVAAAGAILLYGARKYNQGKTKGYQEGLGTNALNNVVEKAVSDSLKEIVESGTNGVGYTNTRTNKKFRFKAEEV